jgi:hypothetical protein
MTDQPMSSDELASALLDGEVPRPQTVDAALGERMEQLRDASQAIAAPLPIDEIARERAIAGALAAFDLPIETPIETPIQPRAASRRFKPALLGAAAAVIVLIGAVALVTRSDDASTTAAGDTAATSTVEALASGASTSTVRTAADAGGAASEAAAATAAPLPASRPLGAFADADALRAALGPDAFTAKTSDAAPQTCETEARAASTADLGALTDNVTLTWQGRPARALLFVDPSGTRGIVVVADPTCEVLDLLG